MLAPLTARAGEGDPARTNRRFHLLAAGQPVDTDSEVLGLLR